MGVYIMRHIDCGVVGLREGMFTGGMKMMACSRKISLSAAIIIAAVLLCAAILAMPSWEARAQENGSEEKVEAAVSSGAPVDLAYLADYYRPDMVREDYQSLIGEWDFEYDTGDVGIDQKWYENPTFTKKINVPFCVESEASGIHDINPPNIVWYAREFDDELSGDTGRTLLHFGAVDYKATVWLNGELLGDHTGGYDPFYYDLAGLLQDSDNLLVVRVEDTNDWALPRGKQSILGFPIAVFYETVIGIWQPVWLERVGEVYLDGYKAYPDMTTGNVRVLCRLAGSTGGVDVKITAISPGGDDTTITESIEVSSAEMEVELVLSMGTLLPWSPDCPNLYGLRITLDRGDSIDEVQGYFGARTVEIIDGMICLNGEPFYQKMTLNQGFYDKGHYTADDPSLYRRDVELVKEFGFNGLRMHVKSEDPRLYFWCDYLGCSVHQDMASNYLLCAAGKAAVEQEWHDIIERNFNHPSITTWIPFNESWGVGLFIIPVVLTMEGKNFVKYMYNKTKEWDPSRLVIDNSGYDHMTETDIIDVHHYIADLDTCQALYDELNDLYNYRWRFIRILSLERTWSLNVLCWCEKYRGQPIMISEYGTGVEYDPADAGQSFLEGYRGQTELIQAQPHLQGYIFTQFNDGGTETGGLVTLDRTPKVPPEEIWKINNP